MSEMATEERWLPVPGHEGAYEVSDMGRVRSVERRVRVRDPRTGGWYLKPVKARVLKACTNSAGYWMVQVSKDSPQKPAYVHHLVASVFIGPRPCGFDVLHRDGDSRNNSATNLYYGTAQENAKDAIRHGVITRGEQRPNHRLRESDIAKIRGLYPAVKLPALSEMFGVSVGAIHAVVTGRTWRHV